MSPNVETRPIVGRRDRARHLGDGNPAAKTERDSNASKTNLFQHGIGIFSDEGGLTERSSDAQQKRGRRT